MNIQKVKLGAEITLYNGIYAVVLGLFYIVFSTLIMSRNFRAISSIWDIFVKYNPQIASLFLMFHRLQGISLISFGIMIIYLSLFISKRKDKYAWIILFISGLVSWAGMLTITIITKNILTIVLSFIGWLSFIIGMVIPIKYYIQKNYYEF